MFHGLNYIQPIEPKNKTQAHIYQVLFMNHVCVRKKFKILHIPHQN